MAMIYELKLLHALPCRERFLVDSLRTDGLYAQLARRTVPGFLGVDLLRNSSCQEPSEFLFFTYWSSLNAYSAAQTTTNATALAHFLSKIALSVNMGVFYTLPDRMIPRFPGASLTQQTEQSSGDTVGLSPNQGNAAGDSEAKGQW
jgi:hypothetical protein